MVTTPVIQLIDRDPVSIDISHKLSEAYRILMAGRIHHLPVVSGQMLVGMLSTTDMLQLKSSALVGDDDASLERLDRHYAIADVMRRKLITISQRATVSDAARQLSAGGFHSLPVVSADNHFVGIVTTTDLVRHLLEAPPKLDLPEDLKQRLRSLEQVRRAAEAYLHSGLATQEHQRLRVALDAAREHAALF